MQVILTEEESLNIYYNALCNGLSYILGHGLELDWSTEEYAIARQKFTSPCFENVLIQILKDGGTLIFNDIEGDGENTTNVTMKEVLERVPNTPFEHLADMLNEIDDATTADVILQTVAFNKVIFG